MTRNVRAPRRRQGALNGVTRGALAAILSLGLMSACGGTLPSANETTATAGAATGSAEIPELLQFTAPLVGGGQFAGAGYAGRATAFWFWAPT